MKILGNIWTDTIFALIFSLGIAVFYHHTTITSPDVAWFLYCAEQILDGARIYVDLIEVNAPLSFVIYFPAVLISKTFGTEIFLTQAIITAGFCTLSFLIVRGLTFGRIKPYLWLAVILVLPGWDFGQREHIIAVFVAPGIFYLAERAAGTTVAPRYAILAIALSAVGAAIKPHFLLLPIALWCLCALLSWQSGKREILKSATICFISAGVMFGVSVIVFPDFIALTRDFTLKFYGGNSFDPVAYTTLLLSGIPLLVPIAAPLLLHDKTISRIAAYRIGFLFAAVAFALVIFLWQKKANAYLLLPAQILTFALMIELVAAWPLIKLQELKGISGILTRTGAAILLTFAISWPLIWTYASIRVITQSMANSAQSKRMKHAQRVLRDQFVMDISINPPLAIGSLLWQDVEWVSRFPTQWAVSMTTAQMAHAEPVNYAVLKEVRNFLRQSAATDLATNKPRYLTCTQETPIGTPSDKCEVLAFFRDNSEFNATFQKYQLVDNRFGFDVYEKRPAE